MKRKFFIVLLFFVGLAFFLSQVFSGQIILPQSFSLGPLVIHYYGIIMALAVAAAFFLATKRAIIYGLNVKLAEDLLFWLITGGFIGARLYHVASSLGYYSVHPADMIKVWNGGLSIYGALIGGLLVLIAHQQLGRRHSERVHPSEESQNKREILNPSDALGIQDDARGGSILNILDWLTPSIILGQIIGRFGNLFNYEAFGYPTNLPWKMFVPLVFRPDQYRQFNFFHPFFLYEVLGNVVILFLLMKINTSKITVATTVKSGNGLSCFASSFTKATLHKKVTQGKLFFSYLLLYNSLRFGLEYLRVDSTFIGGTRLNAITSLLIILISIGALIYLLKHDQTS